jgi:hypothetical protein
MGIARRLRLSVLALACAVPPLVAPGATEEPPAEAMTIVRGNVLGPAQLRDAAVGMVLEPAVRDALAATPDLEPYVLVSADGQFELKAPRRLGAIVLIARAPGFAPVRTRPVSLTSAEQRVGTLKLTKGGMIVGRVVDDAVAPISRAQVTALEAQDPKDPLPASVKPSIATDANGQFRLAGLAASTVDLRVEKEAYTPRALKAVPAGIAPPPIEIKLSPATFLSGWIVDPAQNPIPAANVVATWENEATAQTLTTSDGAFKLGPFAPGTRTTLSVSARGYARGRSDDITAPDSNVRMVLDRNGVLRGRVFDAGTGRPIQKFQVLFQRRPSNPLLTAEYPGNRTFESNEGRFEWSDLQSGLWTITIDAEGYQLKAIAGLRIPQGQDGASVEVALERGPSLAGAVFDAATGEPIAGATVGEKIYGAPLPAFNVVRAVTTRRDGSFLLTGLPSERVVVSITSNGYLSEEREIAPLSQGALEIRLSKGGSITGTLFRSDGVTPAQGLVRLTSPQTLQSVAVPASADGRFAFSMVRNGKYSLSAESEFGLAPETELIVAGNQRKEGVELKLQRGGAVHGQVSGLMPGERGRTEIQIAGETYMLSAPVAEDGSYSRLGVPPGPATVIARTPLDRELSQSLEISGQRDVAVNFEFPAGLRLSGNVRRAGSSVRFAQITAEPVAGRLVRAAGESNLAGQYVIHGLSQGQYIVKVRDGPAVQIDLTSDAVLDFELPPR